MTCSCLSFLKEGIDVVDVHCCRAAAACSPPAHEVARQRREGHEEANKSTIAKYQRVSSTLSQPSTTNIAETRR